MYEIYSQMRMSSELPVLLLTLDTKFRVTLPPCLLISSPADDFKLTLLQISKYFFADIKQIDIKIFRSYFIQNVT